jgi:hypothetical protein
MNLRDIAAKTIGNLAALTVETAGNLALERRSL